jgi:hypothetical protein
MRYARLLALAFATAACSDAATSPNAAPVNPSRPSFDAGNGAHFLSLSAEIVGANLVISFREAGLGNSPVATVNVAAIAAGTATYACINGGGKHPQATNKEEVSGPVGASGDFDIRKNGSAVGTLTLTPPPSTLECPNGQSFVLADVTYTNVFISDNTNGVLDVAVGGGPFTAVFLVLD